MGTVILDALRKADRFFNNIFLYTIINSKVYFPETVETRMGKALYLEFDWFIFKTHFSFIKELLERIVFIQFLS